MPRDEAEGEDIPESEQISVPKPSPPKVHVEHVILYPALTLKEAKTKWENQRLTLEGIQYQPKISTFFQTEDGKAKLLLLKGVLDKKPYDRAYTSVRNSDYDPASNSRRKCLEGSPGGTALFGHSDQVVTVGKGAKMRTQKYPQRTAPSQQQYPRFRALLPLAKNTEDRLRDYMPEYWKGRQIGDLLGPAPRGEGEDNEFFEYPEEYKEAIKSDTQWELFYNVPGTNWSSLIVNWDTIFLGHVDKRNAAGALSALVAFGEPGATVFPRLSVAITCEERDLLICDCPREIHGTIPAGGIGYRYSMVCYTRAGLTTMGIRRK